MNQTSACDRGVQDPPDPDAPASPAETRAALLERALRDSTPIHKNFVQKPERSADRSAPLAEFVRKGDRRGLLALLFVHAVTSSGASKEGWSTTLPLPVWARAFGITQGATDASASTSTSKILKRLEDRKLIQRSRGPKRMVRLTLLMPDGSGDPYSRPTGSKQDRFLKLPHAFWTKGWHERLSLPALAMLLVSLHDKPRFELATERMTEWYGFSPDTAERGFKELQEHGLLVVDHRNKKAPLAPTGQTRVNVYQLTGPFARQAQASNPAATRLEGLIEKGSPNDMAEH